MDDYRLLALDTASNNSGYALYTAGKLKESGVISCEGDTEERIDKMCNGLMSLLNRIHPGTIVIELTVVDRGTATQRMLSEIVGAVRGWAASNVYDDGIKTEFIEYRPNTWRKLVCLEGETFPKKRNDCKVWAVKKVKEMYDMDVTDDRADAILIGQARINEAEILFNED